MLEREHNRVQEGEQKGESKRVKEQEQKSENKSEIEVRCQVIL